MERERNLERGRKSERERKLERERKSERELKSERERKLERLTVRERKNNSRFIRQKILSGKERFLNFHRNRLFDHLNCSQIIIHLNIRLKKIIFICK